MNPVYVSFVDVEPAGLTYVHRCFSQDLGEHTPGPFCWCRPIVVFPNDIRGAKTLSEQSRPEVQ